MPNKSILVFIAWVLLITSSCSDISESEVMRPTQPPQSSDTASDVSESEVMRPTQPPQSSDTAVDRPEVDLSKLAECPAGDALLTYFPLNEGDHDGITPLGNLMPPAHVFPTDHMYVSVAGSTYDEIGDIIPGNSRPLLAPADMLVLQIHTFETILSAGGGWTEYDFTFGICREVGGKFGHVGGLAPKLLEAISTPSADCYEYSTGSLTDRRYKVCNYNNLTIDVVAGEVIGSVGERNGNLDVWFRDYRKPALEYAEPSRWSMEAKHTRCFLDYYPEEMKSRYYDMLGDLRYGVMRTVEPKCGEIAVDLRGTAKGNWVFQLQGRIQHEDPHLALVNDAIRAEMQMVSMGVSAMQIGIMPGRYVFNPETSGFVNRDFGQVTPDGNVYCYDGDTAMNQGGGQPEKTLILLQMPDADTLRVGKGVGSCSDPQVLGEYIEFTR
jgi:hypothetical protein